MSSSRDGIAKLWSSGRSPNEIARELRLAGSTVDYHLARMKTETNDASARESQLPVVPEACRHVRTRELVAALLTEGLSRTEISRRLGIGKGTVSYHARRLGAAVDSRGARRYDWSAVQRYYDLGHAVRECQERFGFSRQSWHAAVTRGAIAPRPAALPLEELLVADTYRSRHNLKLRLLGAGVKKERGEICGLKEWRDRTLSLALHHVNGIRDDNRLENLQLLCPNCHSQAHTDASPQANGR